MVLSEHVYRRDIPLVITFVVAVIAILDYFVKNTIINTASATLLVWTVPIQGFAMFLGVIGILQYQARLIMRRGSGLPYSLLLIVVFVTFVVVGQAYGGTSTLYVNLYTATGTALNNALTGMLAFHFITGMYVGFRGHSKTGFWLMLGGVIGLISIPPYKGVLGTWPVENWMNSFVVTSVNRVVVMTAAAGALVLAFRTILGWEKGYLRET
jgi:hypothetical protein